MEEYKKAANAYRACLELDPDFKFARNNLGKSLMRAMKYDEAVEVLREAVERGQDGDEPRQNLAKALRRLGRYAEAAQVLNPDTQRGKRYEVGKRKHKRNRDRS